MYIFWFFYTPPAAPRFYNGVIELEDNYAIPYFYYLYSFYFAIYLSQIRQAKIEIYLYIFIFMFPLFWALLQITLLVLSCQDVYKSFFKGKENWKNFSLFCVLTWLISNLRALLGFYVNQILDFWISHSFVLTLLLSLWYLPMIIHNFWYKTRRGGPPYLVICAMTFITLPMTYIFIFANINTSSVRIQFRLNLTYHV